MHRKLHTLIMLSLVALVSLLGISVGAGLTEPPVTDGHTGLVEVVRLAKPLRPGGITRRVPLGSGAGRYTTGFV